MIIHTQPLITAYFQMVHKFPSIGNFVFGILEVNKYTNVLRYFHQNKFRNENSQAHYG
jgi:hypothetical protein